MRSHIQISRMNGTGLIIENILRKKYGRIDLFAPAPCDNIDMFPVDFFARPVQNRQYQDASARRSVREGAEAMSEQVNILNSIGTEYAKGYVNEEHRHPHYHQIFYFISGAAVYRCGGEKVRLSRHELLIVPPNMLHGMVAEEDKTMVLDIKCEILGHELSRLPSAQTHRHILCEPEERSMFETMFRVAREKQPFHAEILRGLLTAFLYLHLQSDAASASALIGPQKYSSLSLCARKTLWFIETLVIPGEPHSLDKIARTVGYNKHYMCRCFSEEVGMSIFQYLTLLRMDKAKELLSKTDHSVRHIGALLGYHDAATFIKLFKKHCGMTPGSYRASSPSEAGQFRYTFREPV